jgi:hypothetical protein
VASKSVNRDLWVPETEGGWAVRVTGPHATGRGLRWNVTAVRHVNGATLAIREEGITSADDAAAYAAAITATTPLVGAS